MYLYTDSKDPVHINNIKLMNKEIVAAVQEIQRIAKHGFLIKSQSFFCQGSIKSNECFCVSTDVKPEDKEIIPTRIWILPMTAWEDIDIKVVDKINIVMPERVLAWWQALETLGNQS